MICHHTEFKLPSSNVIDIKLKGQVKFPQGRHAVLQNVVSGPIAHF
jgi:hypothetical protein